MKIPANVIANADDLGLNNTVNAAILLCYQKGYINSTSVLTNMPVFDTTVLLIKQNPVIQNIGVHINLAEGRPLTNFNQPRYLNNNGDWNLALTNKKLARLTPAASLAFSNEIDAQINRALAAGIAITHLDSHYHIHTLPCFYRLFLKAAKRHQLKLRLAQTYNEGSLLKFAYRKYINRAIKKSHVNYTNRFETIDYYLKNSNNIPDQTTELMLHPDMDTAGRLTDHYDAATMLAWMAFLDKA